MKKLLYMQICNYILNILIDAKTATFQKVLLTYLSEVVRKILPPNENDLSTAKVAGNLVLQQKS